MPVTINGNGTITGVSVGGLPDGIVDTDMLAANAVSSAKLASGAGGKILQVVHVDKNDFFSTTSTSFTDITGLTANITPTSASNYILVDFKCSCSGGSNLYATLRIQRLIAGGSYGDPSVITPSSQNADACHAGADNYVYGNYKISQRGATIKDQPNTTLQVSYKIQVRGQSVGFSLNRTERANGGNDATSLAQGVSSITLMEVAA